MRFRLKANRSASKASPRLETILQSYSLWNASSRISRVSSLERCMEARLLKQTTSNNWILQKALADSNTYNSSLFTKTYGATELDLSFVVVSRGLTRWFYVHAPFRAAGYKGVTHHFCFRVESRSKSFVSTRLCKCISATFPNSFLRLRLEGFLWTQHLLKQKLNSFLARTPKLFRWNAASASRWNECQLGQYGLRRPHPSALTPPLPELSLLSSWLLPTSVVPLTNQTVCRMTTTTLSHLCRPDWLFAIRPPSMRHPSHPVVSSFDVSATSEAFSTTGTLQQWCKVQKVPPDLNTFRPSDRHRTNSRASKRSKNQDTWSTWVTSIKHPALNSKTQSREHFVQDINKATLAGSFVDF